MRFKRYSRRAAVALTALGVVGAVAAAGTAQGATTPPWRITHTFPRSSEIYAVAATGVDNAWAAGSQCDSSGDCTPNGSLLVEHWNGKTWQPMKPPGGLAGLAPGGSAAALAASSPGNVWVLAESEAGAGERAVAQHWTGRAWAKPTAFAAWTEMSAVVTTGERNAWAFGQLVTPSASYVVHYNGATWDRVPFPVDVAGASAVSAGDIWAVGSWAGTAPKGASPFAVEHWTGSAWHTVPVPALKLPKGIQGVQPESVVAEGANDVWAAGYLTEGQGVGNGIALLHWNGRKFAQVTVPYPITGPFYLSGDGTGGIWLSAVRVFKNSYGTYLYRYFNGHWTQVGAPNEPKNTTQFDAMTLIPGTHSVWATGAGFSPTIDPGQGQGLILKYGP
jgi:hypothetical protein